MEYWIQRWSNLRREEMVKCPNILPIHIDYRGRYTALELTEAFHILHNIMKMIYSDAIQNPERMLLPIYAMSEYGYFSNENRLSREMSYKYAHLLCALGVVGECDNEQIELVVNIEELKSMSKKMKITNISKRLEILKDYGFELEGCDNGKFIKGLDNIIVSFPDNKSVMQLLKYLADKAYNTDHLLDFCQLNYKLLKDGEKEVCFGEGIDYITDLFDDEHEREVAVYIHNELVKRGYFFKKYSWNEGPMLRYYNNESDAKKNTNSPFWLTSIDAKFQFYFRIRKIEKILDYIKTCPKSVIDTFMCSDKGCKNRGVSCNSGIQYELCGEIIWRCGCCNPNFHLTPEVKDCIYYIDAVEQSNRLIAKR